MKTIALLIIGGAIVIVVIIGQSNEDGISGVWNDFIGDDEPPIAKIETEFELDISTP
jgi:hypothetical protein